MLPIRDWVIARRLMIAWHPDSTWGYWGAEFAYVLEIGRLQLAWLRA